MTLPPLRVAVVGAGSAGLAMAQQMLEVAGDRSRWRTNQVSPSPSTSARRASAGCGVIGPSQGPARFMHQRMLPPVWRNGPRTLAAA